MAAGLSAACARAVSAISPRCSRRVPYSCMWRTAWSASQLAADMAPKGITHCAKPDTLRAPAPMPSRPVPAEARRHRERGEHHGGELRRPLAARAVPAELEAEGVLHVGRARSREARR